MFWHNSQDNERGFTLALSVLVASLLLIIGFAVSIIMLKELRLSFATRDSQLAFYAADAAAECAIYWDTTTQAGGQSAFGGFDNTGANFAWPFFQNTSSPPSTYNMLCNNENITVASTGWDTDSTTDTDRDWYTVVNGSNTQATTYFDMAFTNGSCATVTVTKDAQVTPQVTTIEARGYNTCNLTSPRRVERAIRVEY